METTLSARRPKNSKRESCLPYFITHSPLQSMNRPKLSAGLEDMQIAILGPGSVCGLRSVHEPCAHSLEAMSVTAQQWPAPNFNHNRSLDLMAVGEYVLSLLRTLCIKVCSLCLFICFYQTSISMTFSDLPSSLGYSFYSLRQLSSVTFSEHTCALSLLLLTFHPGGGMCGIRPLHPRGMCGIRPFSPRGMRGIRTFHPRREA